MKNTFILLWLSFAVSFLIGCKPEKQTPDKIQGRVQLVHSNTPVAGALVLFLKANYESWIVTYQEVGRDTTDENGYFIVPKYSNAELVRAYGPASLYDMPSVDNYIDWDGTEPLNPRLIPPAWLKVRAIDVAPLNPEVTNVYADTLAGTDGEVNISNEFQIWRTDGNMEQSIYYYIHYNNQPFEWYTKDILPPEPFDTTEIIIEY